ALLVVVLLLVDEEPARLRDHREMVGIARLEQSHDRERGVVGRESLAVDTAVGFRHGKQICVAPLDLRGQGCLRLARGIPENRGNGEGGERGKILVIPGPRGGILSAFEKSDPLVDSPLDLKFQRDIAIGTGTYAILGGGGGKESGQCQSGEGGDKE